MILIVTANSTLGSAVARRLLAQGNSVRGLVRSPEKGEALRELGGEVVIGDLRDPPSLARACERAEQVVAAAHSLMGRGKDASKFVDLQGHKDLIDAAKAAGVEHFVYTSIYPCDGFDCVPFVRMRQEVERYLEASGLPHTIIRPTAFMEFHAEALIGKPILETGKVSLFGRGDNPRNFVAADDVAHVVVMVLTDPALRGGGPSDLPTNGAAQLPVAALGATLPSSEASRLASGEGRAGLRATEREVHLRKVGRPVAVGAGTGNRKACWPPSAVCVELGGAMIPLIDVTGTEGRFR